MKVAQFWDWEWCASLRCVLWFGSEGVLNIFWEKGCSVNKSISDKGVCRTAPAGYNGSVKKRASQLLSEFWTARECWWIKKQTFIFYYSSLQPSFSWVEQMQQKSQENVAVRNWTALSLCLENSASLCLENSAGLCLRRSCQFSLYRPLG